MTQVPPSGATASFTHTLALGAPSVTLTFNVTATNGSTTSAPVVMSVTVAPVPDSITITTAEYRTGKQRLTINATSSVVSPNVSLTLDPYVTDTGLTFDPATLGNLFTNGGGGLYTISLVGAPRPACDNPSGAYATPCPTLSIKVRSSLGGVGASALTRIRQ